MKQENKITVTKYLNIPHLPNRISKVSTSHFKIYTDYDEVKDKSEKK